MNILSSESAWYACQLPPCLERQIKWIFKCSRGSSASLAQGKIFLKRDSWEQHYAAHGTHTNVLLFCLAVKIHPGPCGQVLPDTNAGSAPLDLPWFTYNNFKKRSCEQFKTMMWPTCPVRSHTGHIHVCVCVCYYTVLQVISAKKSRKTSNCIVLSFQKSVIHTFILFNVSTEKKTTDENGKFT